MKTLTFSLIAIIMLAASRCLVEDFYVITVRNDLGKSVFFFETGLPEDSQYPDTLLPAVKPDLAEIKSNERFRIYSRTKWEDVFSSLRSDTLSVYFFDSDTLNKYDWSKIREGYKVLKRYDLSLQDLERLNYLVTYPPTNEMKGIKMYPK